MKIRVDTKQLAMHLTTASKLCEKFSAVIINTEKDGINITISSPEHYYTASMAATVEKKGSFVILPELLSSILKTRANELEFSVKDQRLTFKSVGSHLSGKDIALLSNEQVRDPQSSKNKIALPKKMQRRILALLDTCAIHSFYGKTLSQSLSISKGVTTVCCIDAACASIGTITSNEKANLASVDLPAEYSERLKYIPGDDFSFSFTNDLMLIDTDSAHVELKMLQSDKIGTLQATLDLEKKKVICSFQVDSSQLKQELDSLMVTYEKGVPLQMELKNTTLQLRYKTSNGEFSSGLTVNEIKNQASFMVDAEIIRALLNKISGKVTVKVRSSVVALHFEPEKAMSVRFFIALLNPSNRQGEKESE